MVNHILEKYLILKLLSRYPNSTRYLIHEKMVKLQFSIRHNTFYSIFRFIEERNLVKFDRVVVPTKQVNRGTWYSRTKEVILYSLTDNGYKEMHRLEAVIRIALTSSIWGEKV